MMFFWFVVGLAFTCTANANPPRFRTENVDRIVGGQNAGRGEIPWQVSVQRMNWMLEFSHFCGGAVLDSNYVITAAHCVDEYNAFHLQVVAGEYDMNTKENTEQTVKVDKIIQHQDFENLYFRGDVALLKVTPPLKLNQFVSPVLLPDPAEDFSGLCQVSGWGYLREGGEKPDVLQKVSVPIVSDDSCQKAYKYVFNPESHLCAGFVEGGRDACKGDSGGPLICRGPDGKGRLAGIVSYGHGCGAPKKFGIYTKVSQFIGWISAHKL